MAFSVVKTVLADEETGATFVILGDDTESKFFWMRKWPDGTFIRPAGGGMSLQTRSDFDYAAIGAKLHDSVQQAESNIPGMR